MKTHIYHIEFLEELDKVLEHFVISLENTDESLLKFGRHSMKTTLLPYLFCQLIREENHYNMCRMEGMTVIKAMEKVTLLLDSFRQFPNDRSDEGTLAEPHNHSWYKELSAYCNQLVIYIFDLRQLQYLTSLIKVINQPILLLSECELPDETDFPDSVTALTISFSEKRGFTNSFLERHFPLLFQYANTLSLLVQILSPKGVICLGGCYFQEQLLATVAQDYGIQSVGIQQSWPPFMHTGFRRFPYRYFLTWGEEFDEGWKKYNPLPEFLPMGVICKSEVNGFQGGAEVEVLSRIVGFINNIFGDSRRDG